MKTDVSIVIINKNDRGISATLAACSAIKTKLCYEIVVVDSSEGKLDDIKRAFPKVTWIRFTPSPNKPITIPEARNAGVRAAKGTVIVFIDANCVPEANWLDTLVAPIIRKEEVIVAGATYSKGKTTTHDELYNDSKTKRYLDECPTINLAFTRELFDVIGGFDERFDYGSDVDFSWRVIAAGHKVRYEAAAKIIHDWGNRKQELRRSFRYGKARARLYRKHHDWKRLITLDHTLIIYPVFIVGLPLVIVAPWYPLLILIPIIKNIHHKPFTTIASHLAYALGVLDEYFIEPFYVRTPGAVAHIEGALS